MKFKKNKSKKICNCGCPKSLRLKTKLQKQNNKHSQKKQSMLYKTNKNCKTRKKQNSHTKKIKYSNKKSNLNTQNGGSNCRMGLMTEKGFKIPENNSIKGLTILDSKALITNKPGCISSNLHP